MDLDRHSSIRHLSEEGHGKSLGARLAASGSFSLWQQVLDSHCGCLDKFASPLLTTPLEEQPLPQRSSRHRLGKYQCKTNEKGDVDQPSEPPPIIEGWDAPVFDRIRMIDMHAF